MRIKLSVFSREELQRLSIDIEREIQKRDERTRIANIMDAPIDIRGMEISQPNFKYQHPVRKTLSWSGRGRIPSWMNELIESGYSKDDLRVME